MLLPVSAASASSYVGIVYKWTDCENFSRYSSTHVYIPDSPTNQLSISWAASEINYNGWTGWSATSQTSLKWISNSETIPKLHNGPSFPSLCPLGTRLGIITKFVTYLVATQR